MATTLTEDLLLVLQDDAGRSRVGSTYRHLVLAGGVLAELVLDGALRGDVEGDSNGDGDGDGDGEPRGHGERPGRLVATGRPPSAAVLGPFVDLVAGLRPQRAVERLTGRAMSGGPVAGLRTALLGGLRDRGALVATTHRVLGLFPTTRWVPAPGDGLREEVTARVRGALTGTADPEPRTAALVSLLLAAQALPRVVPDLDRGEVRRRAREVADGDWAGAAVRSAIEEINTAVVAAAGTALLASSS